MATISWRGWRGRKPEGYGEPTVRPH
jgi:hypothetical protein